jgi:hypothetical protein
MDKCPQCGAANLESGTLMVKGSPWDIRFLRDGTWGFGFKDKVRAVACRSCGHIALLLAAVVRPAAAGEAQDAEPGAAAAGGA